MDESGAHGVMIGRGCCGKPWMLQQTIDYLNGRSIPDPPDAPVLLALILDHFAAILEHYGQRQGVAIARKHLAWYCADMAGANDFRRAINKEKDPDTVRAMIADFFGNPAEIHRCA